MKVIRLLKSHVCLMSAVWFDQVNNVYMANIRVNVFGSSVISVRWRIDHKNGLGIFDIIQSSMRTLTFFVSKTWESVIIF